MLAALTGGAGWTLAHTGATISQQVGISETIVGALFIAVATSTPELVTTIASVRRGALTMAVGGILGGNAFDVMFAVAADVAYRPGSIYHAISHRERFLTSLALLMTSILLLGMLFREKKGPANIGFESLLILLFYGAGLVILTLMG